jgi:hypothetical protein
VYGGKHREAAYSMRVGTEFVVLQKAMDFGLGWTRHVNDYCFTYRSLLVDSGIRLRQILKFDCFQDG